MPNWDGAQAIVSEGEVLNAPPSLQEIVHFFCYASDWEATGLNSQKQSCKAEFSNHF